MRVKVLRRPSAAHFKLGGSALPQRDTRTGGDISEWATFTPIRKRNPDSKYENNLNTLILVNTIAHLRKGICSVEAAGYTYEPCYARDLRFKSLGFRFPAWGFRVQGAGSSRVESLTDLACTNLKPPRKLCEKLGFRRHRVPRP